MHVTRLCVICSLWFSLQLLFSYAFACALVRTHAGIAIFDDIVWGAPRTSCSVEAKASYSYGGSSWSVQNGMPTSFTIVGDPSALTWISAPLNTFAGTSVNAFVVQVKDAAGNNLAGEYVTVDS
jgi:hypothetical protein